MKTEDMCSIAFKDRHTQELTLPAGTSKAVPYTIVPLVVGKLPLEVMVVGRDMTGGDRIQKFLRVVVSHTRAWKGHRSINRENCLMRSLSEIKVCFAIELSWRECRRLKCRVQCWIRLLKEVRRCYLLSSACWSVWAEQAWGPELRGWPLNSFLFVRPSVPLLWTRSLRCAEREFLQIWGNGVNDELI